MVLNSTTLRPGYLVSLKTTLTGNVEYNKLTIEERHRASDGSDREKWVTERTVNDPQEHERAVKARGAASARIRGVCAKSAFGLLCPEARVDELEKAIRSARDIAEEFNESSELTKINVYVITGRVAQDDVEAARAIRSEMRELLQEMEDGVKTLDVERIREAANKARSVGQMLSKEASERVADAINAARAVARNVVKAGEQAALEVDTATLRQISEARMAFLDIDAPAPSPDATPDAATTAAPAIDLDPETAPPRADIPDEGNGFGYPPAGPEIDNRRRPEEEEATPVLPADEPATPEFEWE